MTVDLAQRLAAISTEIGSPLCVHLNRRGQVVRVGVGAPGQNQIPAQDLPRYGRGRLSGLRCLVTQREPSPPAEALLIPMVQQRLDALVVLVLSGAGFARRGGGAAGYVKSVYLAHLTLGDPAWLVSQALALEVLAQEDFLGLVQKLEDQLQQSPVAHRVKGSGDQVLLVGLHTDRRTLQEFQEGLRELARLVETAGGTVVETIEQKRSHPQPHTLVGAGKVQEICLGVQRLEANLVVFDQDLSPAQVRALEQRIGVRVLDRTEVILDIFARRAQSQAGKLQVELAQLEYLLPRLAGRGQAMSRLGGGIGTRGPGETKLETDRRLIQSRISRLQREVDQLQAHRSRLRQLRQQREIPCVALVGYTNAGKSTLLNSLTQAKVYTADQLFATLDPTTRRLHIPGLGRNPQEVLLVDTVGFIRDLPAALMDAFRATLEEVTEADALLVVVDLSHGYWRQHLETVMDILQEMPVHPGPHLVVFNKVDQVTSSALAAAQAQYPRAVFVSGQDRLGLETLRRRLGELVELACAR